MQFFGAAITKKTAFFAQKWQKKPFLGLKQCFWGLSGQLLGSPVYFEGAGLKEKCFARFWSK